jgi:hypothetical protein
LLIAQQMGVLLPNNIRIIEQDGIPQPTIELLNKFRRQNNLLSSNTLGLTIGYNVFIKRGFITSVLLAHEFRHVHQYEQFGSIELMVKTYLEQLMQYGYANSPLELDADTMTQNFILSSNFNR